MTPTAQSIDPPALTKEQVSKNLHISVRHLEHLIKAKAIAVMRFGKSVRITPEAVKAFKESRTVKAVA